MYNVPQDNIEVEFFIVKRKLFESDKYVINRIQTFVPASGKVKMNRVTKSITDFIEQAFNREGFSDVEHQPRINGNCKYCPFHKTHLCTATF